MLRRVIATIKSASPYAQGKPFMEKKGDCTYEEFEEKTWKNRLHINDQGKAFIPPGCFKLSLAEAAKYRPRKVPGNGKATYTKHFVAGVLVTDPLTLDITADEVRKLTLFVPSDGIRGGGRRVFKHFPTIDQWAGQVEYLVTDDVITEEVFEQTLTDSGRFIGIGVSRPINNGYFGRFSVEKIEWVNED